jgi:hypothetical protein
MRRRDKKHFLTEEDLGLLAASDPEARKAWDRWDAIKAKGGRPVAWRTGGGSYFSYFVRDDLEVQPWERQ